MSNHTFKLIVSIGILNKLLTLLLLPFHQNTFHTGCMTSPPSRTCFLPPEDLGEGLPYGWSAGSPADLQPSWKSELFCRGASNRFFRRWVEDVFFFLQARCSFLVRMTSQAQGSRFPRLDVPIGELQDDVFFIFLVLGWHLALDVPLKAVHYWCLVVLPAFNPFV